MDRVNVDKIAGLRLFSASNRGYPIETSDERESSDGDRNYAEFSYRRGGETSFRECIYDPN